MESQVFSKIVEESSKRINEASAYTKHRYLYSKIKEEIGKKYIIGIYGLRGIGKTVLMLQLASELKNALYVSADAAPLANYSIYEIGEEAFNKGFEYLFIDEVNTKPSWTYDLKTLYDEGHANIMFSGSSAAGVMKGADLSRRVIMHELLPPSLREFLNIRYDAGIEKLELPSLYDNEKRRENAIKYSRWGSYWHEFYTYGGVLYDAKIGFPNQLLSTLERILRVDLASLRPVDASIINDIYKLLYKIAEAGPYEISYTSLANHIGLSVKTTINIVKDLEKVGLLKLVYPLAGGIRKEPKVYFRIPFRSAINESRGIQTQIGIAREEFFVNSVNVGSYIKTERGEKTADFVVEGKKIEVGGAWKTNYQGADFLAVDGTDFMENKIPLFLFGLLY